MKRAMIDFALGDQPQIEPNWEGSVDGYWAVASTRYELDSSGRRNIINLRLLRLYDDNGDTVSQDKTDTLEEQVCEQIEFEWGNK